MSVLTLLFQSTGHSIEQTLEEIEQREREARAGRGPESNLTPLLQFFKDKKEEKMRKREELKELRRKKDDERRKAREEERLKRKDKEKRDKKDPERLPSDSGILSSIFRSFL